MELAKNPFFVLGATIQDDRRRILELEEEKTLSSDETAVREAAATLVNPRKRLTAELAWLLGLRPNQVTEVLSALMTNPRSILNQSDLPPLARANLLADGLKQSATTLSFEDMIQWVIELSKVYDDLNVDQTIVFLNQDRLVAGLPKIPEDSPHVGVEINARRQYFVGAIQNTFNQLSWEDRVQAVTAVVSQVTNEGLNQAPVLIDDLVDKFEVEAQDFLEKESENIYALIGEVLRAAQTKKSKAGIDRLINRLEGLVKNWDIVAQPVQVSARSRGLQHALSNKISGKIRNLAIELTNEYGLIDLSQKLVILQQEVFAEVDKIVEQSEEDASVLNKFAEWNKLRETLQGAKPPSRKPATRPRRKTISRKNSDIKRNSRKTNVPGKTRKQVKMWLWLVAGVVVIVGLNEFAKDEILLWAANNGYSRIVQLLVTAGADVHAQNEIGTPLHGAAYGSHTEVVSILLREKAHVNARSYSSKATPLHLAVGKEKESAKIVELLLLAGADVHARMFSFSIGGGQTPLHAAAWGGSTEVVKLLLLAGADIHADDKAFGTPLHHAALGGNVEVVRLLLSLGSVVNEKDDISITPLHGAAQAGHTEVVKLLLSMGADIHAKDWQGSTPLHYAAGHSESPEVVKFLISAGANVHEKNSQDLTPLDSAVKRENTEIEKVLRAYGEQ